MGQETGFEKRRGVSRVEVRHGFTQLHLSRLEGDVALSRLKVLKSIAEAGVNLDFLKLTPSGLSCLISDAESAKVDTALSALNVHFSLRSDRSIVLVHAVNMRDEEGLISSVVKVAIASGARIEHISDMHDRMLVVVHSSDAEPLKERLIESLVQEEAVGRS